jgi:uncharacterized membrane protein
MLPYQNVLMIISITLLGLMAGLLYGYSCSVNPGLAKLTDAEYIKAMQSINEAIQNPVFFVSFIGSMLVLPFTTWQVYDPEFKTCYNYMLLATLVYVVGVFGITLLGNVPLNNRLANYHLDANNESDIRNVRIIFEDAWSNFHLARTVSAVVAFVLSILSLYHYRT